MDLMGGLLSELVFLAASVLLMQVALRRRREGGLFAALPLGVLPAVALAGLLFWQLQQHDDADVKAARASMLGSFDSMAAARFPDPAQAEERKQLKAMGVALFEVVPGIELTLRLVLLAALAVLLRRRRSRAGLAVKAAPLSRWSAPFWLTWLILLPVFWLLAGHQGLMDPPAWSDRLCYNALFVGTAIQIFHGSVVLFGKVLGWWRDPRTRILGLAASVMALMSVPLMGGDPRPLLVFITLTGLFEPWLDLRRLQQPPPQERLDGHGGA